jgi:prepilin signal peptidase PulO-like enzyme (type II secretory pathway)
MIVLVGLFTGILGGALGSFAGVIAARGLRPSLGGRSHCDHCRRTLQWYELIPILSYPALRGRCRTCHSRVGVGVYAWEVGGAVLALAVATPMTLALHLTAL